MLARHVGYVFQNPGHQLFARTVADELAFGPRNLGCQRDEIERRVSSVAERLGLTDVLDRHPLRLPYPLRKLACIGSVLTMEPRVLVLDEPTAGQDHRTAHRIADLVVELRQGGTTVVCASHDLRLVGQLADRVVVLRDGRLVGDGPPRALLSDRELLRATGLVPPQITELSLAMAGRGDRPAALSVGELVDEVRGT
jgi:energy-coupling factor transporter ATP-binding protein EcfA2